MYVTSGYNYCYRSNNLMEWVPIGNTLDTNSASEGLFEKLCSAHVWAPEVIYDEDTELYYMFFSATPAEDTEISDGKGVDSGTAEKQLMVAVSKYPYKDFEIVNFKDSASCGEENLHTYNVETGIKVSSGNTIQDIINPTYKDAYPHYYAPYLFFNPEEYVSFLEENGGASTGKGGYTGAIDAHPFVNDNGDKYLYWTPEQTPKRICAVKMENWLKPDWSTATVITYSQYYTVADWEAAQTGTTVEKVSYEIYDNNEGAAVTQRGDTYYLTYSMNAYKDNTYQVGVAVADSPLGPFRKLTEAEGGILLSGSTTGSQEISGTGHHSFVTIGEQMYIIYHRHDTYYIEGDDTTGGGARNHAIDEVQWIKIKDKDGNDLDVMYVNGPTWTEQPRIEAYCDYKNIADEAERVEADSTVSNISCLNDGLLSTDMNANATFMQYIQETSITQTTTFTFDFSSARAVRGIMVYNSKKRNTCFMNISKIEFIGEDGESVIHTVENVEFSSEYYTDDYVIPGAAAYAVFDELNVKSIRITVAVPEGQASVGISEIKILGK